MSNGPDSRAIHSEAFGAIAIGRNEGVRLKACLASLSSAEVVVYVDSGSIDDSIPVALSRGAIVVSLDPNAPFTAARARNEGFKRLRKVRPDLEFVQFIDGDCQLELDWPTKAVGFLRESAQIAALAGRRYERNPSLSIYNWLCDREWDGPAGKVRSCGGDVMMRAAAFEQVNGFRDEMIAGEEPELCVRLRARGWLVWRLAEPMTSHDASMTRFAQWWRRTLRGGYAYAMGAHLHGGAPEFHKVWESRRAWFWGVLLPLACIASTLIFGPVGLLLALLYLMQLVKQILSLKGTFKERFLLATFQLLARFPEGLGQLAFWRDRLRSKRMQIIEYK